MRKTKKLSNPFLKQNIQITLNVTIKKNSYSDSGQIEYVKPLALQGYLLKEDDKHLYMSDDEKNISFYVQKDNIAFVELLQKKDKYDDILDGVNDSGETIFS